jgi:ankyrin repeat protein
MKETLRFIFSLFLLVSVCGGQPSPAPSSAVLGMQMQQAVLQKQDLNEIQRILKAGFKIDDPIGCGTFNSVDGAVAVENLEILKFLLASGARPKNSALLQAVWSHHPDISEQMVEALLKAGADPNYKDCYMGDTNRFSTPLHIACYQGYFAVVQLLVSQPGVELNTIDIDGYTPLMLAVCKGNKEIVGLLLAKGANPNVAKQRRGGVVSMIDGTTPLGWAEQRAMDDIANMLRGAAGTPGPAIPKPPSCEAMRDIAQRIAAGDEGAFDELVRVADALYQDVDYQKDHSRILSNLIRMHAAFDVLGQEAGKGNVAAFRALKKSMSAGRLNSFAPDALGMAAAAGNQGALDILVRYQESGILESTAIFALAKPVEAGVDPAIDCVGAWLSHLKYDLSGGMVLSTTNALAVAAEKGNQKAQAVLNQFTARIE